MTKIAGAAALIGLLVAGAASADTFYELKDVQFSDGTALTGDFSINGSGYLGTWDVTSLDGTGITGNEYTPSINATYSPGDTSITFYRPSYIGFLTLTFAHALNGTADAILSGATSSFECSGYSCATPNRYVVADGSPMLAVPEPAAWAMMVLGVGGIGGALRRRSVRKAVVTRG